MHKIYFSDKYGLTQAVLDGRKTMTRRTANVPRTFRGIEVAGFRKLTNKQGDWFTELYDEDELTIEGSRLKPHYEVGEVVAIAQSYSVIADQQDEAQNVLGLYKVGDKLLSMEEMKAGWNNKLFVKSSLMPHHIRITGIKLEQLQDISNDECLREGIEEHLKGVQYGFPSNIGYCGQYPFSTLREAFAELIDKVSGKGTFESNKWVFAYEFELID